MKDFITLTLAVAVLVLGGAFFMKDTTVVVNEDGKNVGAFPGGEYYNEVAFLGGLKQTAPVVSIAKTNQYATTTLQLEDSGTTYMLSASGTRITLPAVTTKGWNARFVVGGALDTANVVIASAEGDNIDGTLIVAGAVVDCRGEDFVNFITDGEAEGDYVEVFSDGTQWLIGDSGVLTSAKMTCTDPS